MQLTTNGSNIPRLWQFIGSSSKSIIDKNGIYVYPNDIYALLCAYSVEAARAAILQEIGGVFAVYKIDVDIHHLELTADYMVQYKARAGGFSAPGSFTPLSQPGAPGWGNSYLRSTLPPLNVPSDSPSLPSHSSMYSHTSHTLHPVTPTEDTRSPSTFGSMSYSSTGRDSMMLPSLSSQYQYSDQQSTWFSQTGATSAAHSPGSLSSLLNPSSTMSSSYSTTRPQPAAINTYTSYPPLSHNHHSTGPVSPDSRPLGTRLHRCHPCRRRMRTQTRITLPMPITTTRHQARVTTAR